MHSLCQGPIDSILEKTILRYCIQNGSKWTQMNRLYTAITNSRHQNLRRPFLPAFCPWITHPKCLVCWCQLEASPKVEYWEDRQKQHRTKGTLMVKESWDVEGGVPLVVGLHTPFKWSWLWKHVGNSRIEVNHKDLDFENWRIWVVHKSPTISWRISGLNTCVACHNCILPKRFGLHCRVAYWMSFVEASWTRSA